MKLLQAIVERRDIKSNAKILLCCIALNDNVWCYGSEALATTSGLTRRTVNSIISSLEFKGLVTVDDNRPENSTIRLTDKLLEQHP